jgi:hypothetical protein
MEPEEAMRRYRRSVATAAALVTPILGVAVGLLALARTHVLDSSPGAWFAFGVALPVALVCIAMFTYILTRRCPACACRSPVLRGSNCCRRCGVRLVRF